MIGLKEKGKLLYGLIDWVFQNEQFKQWCDDKDVSLLWIRGGAGRGKTMMSIALIERLGQRFSEENPVVAYFFCQNSNNELNTIGGIIKGLILSLVEQKRDLCATLRDRWDKDNGRFAEDLTPWRALWNIFVKMLNECRGTRIFVIIDALDECQEDDQNMTAFLKLVVRTAPKGLNSNIKWLLTSRPFDSAGSELLLTPDQVKVCLDLNSTHVANAVKSYIIDQIGELNHRYHFGSALCQRLEFELISRSGGTFLWVSLVCERVVSVCERFDAIGGGADQAHVLATVQELPPGLTPLYHRIFDKLTKGKPNVVKSSMRLLKTMLSLYRPLREEELSSVTGLQAEDGTFDRLIDRCTSFIKKQGSSIEFVHKSARDYLEEKEAQVILCSFDDWGDPQIASSCLAYLSRRLRKDSLNLGRPDSEAKSIKTLSGMVEEKPLVDLSYAATFWIQHLTRMLLDALDDASEVMTFLRAKLLEWLECLSWLDQLPYALEGLTLLANKATVSTITTAIPFDSLIDPFEATALLFGFCSRRDPVFVAAL